MTCFRFSSTSLFESQVGSGNVFYSDNSRKTGRSKFEIYVSFKSKLFQERVRFLLNCFCSSFQILSKMVEAVVAKHYLMLEVSTSLMFDQNVNLYCLLCSAIFLFCASIETGRLFSSAFSTSTRMTRPRLTFAAVNNTSTTFWRSNLNTPIIQCTLTYLLYKSSINIYLSGKFLIQSRLVVYDRMCSCSV